MGKKLLLFLLCICVTQLMGIAVEGQDSWRLYRTFREPIIKKRVKALAFNSNGSKLVAITRRHSCFISTWDVDSSLKIDSFNTNIPASELSTNFCIGCNKDASVIAIGLSMGLFCCYYQSPPFEIASKKFIRLLHNRHPVSLRCDNDTNTFLIRLADGTYLNYDADLAEFAPAPTDTELPRLGISTCGNYELSNGSVIDRNNSQNKPCVLKVGDSIASDIACFSNDSSLLATRCPDNTIRMWANADAWAFCQDEER